MSRKEEVGKYVYGQIKALSADTKRNAATLARLRRGAGKVPGELPELWGTFLNGIPDELLSRSGKPTEAEWAIYLSLTLYALHQQGSSESVNSKDIGLGNAAANLMKEPTDDERERVLRRFGPVVTAKDMPELSHHLRCLVELLKSKGIKLDYVRLAKDIFDFQFDDSRKNVQLSWGRDFYYNNKGE
ncbi:MAG: type I-E CRISPR-associated protein Cse2/CasB [Ruminococcus sp.]|nr:type I-E CRISPR-associated protein Cse2/CasB [Ruminococcus sp.]